MSNDPGVGAAGLVRALMLGCIVLKGSVLSSGGDPHGQSRELSSPLRSVRCSPSPCRGRKNG